MSEFKGTKAKWEACKRTNHVQTAPSEGRELRVLQTICSVNTTFISKEEAKANQLLISKAPEMLEMIKKLMAYMPKKNIDDANMYYEALELIKEATEI